MASEVIPQSAAYCALCEDATPKAVVFRYGLIISRRCPTMCGSEATWSSMSHPMMCPSEVDCQEV